MLEEHVCAVGRHCFQDVPVPKEPLLMRDINVVFPREIGS